MSTVIQKFQLVTRVISVADAAGATKFNFSDIAQLRTELRGRTVYIDAIEAYNANDISKDMQNNAVITETIFKYSYLTLNISTPGQAGNQGEYINQMPLVTLHRTQTTTTSPFVRELVRFPGLSVSWDKSYINVGQVIGVIAAPLSFVFGVYYRFGDQKA